MVTEIKYDETVLILPAEIFYCKSFKFRHLKEVDKFNNTCGLVKIFFLKI